MKIFDGSFLDGHVRCFDGHYCLLCILRNIKWDLLELTPMWMRTRWPLKKYFWQKEDIEAIKKEASRIAEVFGINNINEERG